MNAIILTYAVVILLVIIAQWKVYEKAGEAGWACIIPIYSFYILLRIIGKPWWWLLIMLVPFVNLIFAIWALNLLSKSFGKSEGFTVGMIFFPFIFYPILGFGGAEYQGAQSKEAKLERQANSL